MGMTSQLLEFLSYGIGQLTVGENHCRTVSVTDRKHAKKAESNYQGQGGQYQVLNDNFLN